MVKEGGLETAHSQRLSDLWSPTVTEDREEIINDSTFDNGEEDVGKF